MEICLIAVAIQDYSWLICTTDNVNTGNIVLHFRCKGVCYRYNF